MKLFMLKTKIKEKLKPIPLIQRGFGLYKNIIYKKNLSKIPKALKIPRKISLNSLQSSLVLNNHQKHYFLNNQLCSILPGDWDLIKEPICQLDIIKAYKLHFIHGLAWEETDYYRRVISQINENKKVFECASKEEWDARLEKDEALFYQIKSDMKLKTQKELGSKLFWDEIRIAIDRQGNYVFLDGRHRLAIAKTLKLTTIPVFVCVIHANYLKKFDSKIN